MARIGFIGLGNMGGPMARHLLQSRHEIKAFDLVAAALEAVVGVGAGAARSAADAASGVDVVITMLPAGPDVRAVYLGDQGVIAAADPNTLFVDCSTIDVATARQVIDAAEDKGMAMIDAPVSGGVAGAEAASLTFMCGGGEGPFQRAKPYLERMGRNIVHTGGPGNGQAAKICNNMILAISMIGVGEAFVLAEKLGLDHQTLFDVASTASAQCWALNSYCPVPGPVPASPANRNYQAGFTAANMLKDLRLSQDAASGFGADTELGAHATRLYADYAEKAGLGDKDFSGIINMIREKSG